MCVRQPRWTNVAKYLTLQPNGCWGWTGSKSDGYGRVAMKSGGSYALHRAMYEYFVGPIPEGLELDHLCRNRDCSNPSHLEPVTHAENSRRGFYAMKTHCPQGHAYDAENTYLTKENKRICRACQRQHSKNAYKRLLARKAAA